MTDNLRHSIDSGNGSSQNFSQGIAETHDQTPAKVADSSDWQPDLAVEIQAVEILDSSDDCIKVLGLDGRILFMNRGGQVLLGIQDITPFLNTSWIEFWQEGDRQAATEAIARARAGEICTFQGDCPTLSGKPKWWESKVSPIQGADGQIERLLCISRDITERRQIEDRRKQAEQESRESEERYRAIINQAVAGVACVDLNGKLTLVNQKYCDITGYSVDELKQLRMQDFTHPEDLPRNIELFVRMRTEGTPFEIEKRYIRKDGSIVWVNNSVSAIRDRNGQPQSAVAIVLDITERKRAEAALQESEVQFRLFTAASSDTIYKMSADWCEMRLLEGNNFLASARHPSQTWLEQYIPVEEQTRVRAAIAEAIRTKSTFELEHQVIQLDGTIGWTFSRAIPLLNDQNEIVEWLGAASNITARKQAELSAEFLARATQNLIEVTCVEDIIQTIGEQLNCYLQVSVCAFVEIDENTGVATINHCWHQQDVPNLVGIHRLPEFVTGEFFQAVKIGQTIIVRDVKTDPRIADPQQFAALKIGSFINVPLIRDDEWKFTLGIYHQNAYNWRSHEIELMRELASRIWTKLERTRVEIALRESEAKYRSLFNSIDEGYFLADVIFDENNQPIDVYYLETNPAAERIVGRSFAGRRLKEIEPNYEGYWSKIPGWVVQTGKSERLEHYAEPDQKWYDLSVFKVGDESSRRVAVLFNDITDRKRAEAEREQLLANEQQARGAAEALREEAQAANQVKDEFLAVLSHELRSPLNPILGWTRLLQNGKLDETRQREALATIERNAKLQTQLVEDLLDISRIMRGKLSLTVAPVNLAFVITAAVETVRLAAEAKQIQILLDLTTAISAEHNSEGIAPVSGDAARLQQVVWNLLSNAVKFTPNGGQVTVELRQINQLAQIRVMDTGKGISPGFLPHVFDYFRQADATTTRKFGGLGLGLAIAKQIVEMHGGTVKAESPGENQGATFTVQLPVIQQTPSTISEPSYAKATNQETPLSNLQILVVDDDDDTREFQAFLLEQNGARVTAVASGLEALQALDRFIPDVLVSDVGMAEMDGYMLIQQIRSCPCDRGGTIPAIALTAYAAEVDRQKALQVGFQTHITKPVDPEALVKAIVSLLRSDR